MKFCHAAALALVGWYLMVPPVRPGTDLSDLSPQPAPLSQWDTQAAFDTAEECRNFQDYSLKHIPKHIPKHDVVNDAERYTTVFGKCIASDDPRLKAK